MNSIKVLITSACVLFLGQSLMPEGSAQVQPGYGVNPVVSVDAGQLRGGMTPDGVAVFKNIPFAQPPIGDLRWREPVPVKSWTGVRDATVFGPMCHQNDNQNFPHSEDCLQLNVWTPTWPVKSSAPVMVWFHGGGNFAGSGIEPLFNGETLARHGVVLVTANYRLGVFGFFAHPELTEESAHHASGNYGLMDQIQALRWVQQNIAKFGGDPAKVTIFGESAGAADVNSLIASPLTKGLFIRAIAQSGPVSDQSTLADAEKRDVEWVAKLGIGGGQVLAKLRAIPDTELMGKLRQSGGMGVPGMGGGGLMMGIVVDGWVLPEQPTKIYAEGREQKVALMIGNNSQEFGAGMMGRGATPPSDIRQMISQRYGPLSDRALAAYGLSGQSDPPPDPEDGDVMTQWSTDNAFRCGSVQELIWHTAAGNPGYEYQFSRTVHGQEAQGAAHATEIPFIFGTLPVWQNMRHYNETDKPYAAMMQQYWVNFAKTGDPNSGSLVKWPKFDATRRAYIDFTDAGPVAKEGLRRQVCDVFIENQKRTSDK
jgi:para-nitrobenzyl esterase